jgi:glucose/arabinose dehydrogenase
LFKVFLAKGGGAVPSANRIILLRDTNGDGVADTRSIFLSNLYSPFGMTLVGDTLYVANSNAIVRYAYTPGVTNIVSPGFKLVDLPAGRINHHWTKNVIASPDASKLYASVGSNSNAAENGILHEQDRAAIWEIDRVTGKHRVFAAGLRNPVGLAWEPESRKLWVAVNERDELGSDLVPDYITSVRDGGFYGWPYSYYGRHVDHRVDPRPELIERAIVPDYALGSHTASLGLTWSGARALPPRFSQGMFVGQHGSWNRKPFSGFKVIFVPFSHGQPNGQPIDVLTGFLKPNGDALGRPVGVAVDKEGALLVADDVGNTIWRVTRSPVR